jgi:hypothetical protein
MMYSMMYTDVAWQTNSKVAAFVASGASRLSVVRSLAAVMPRDQCGTIAGVGHFLESILMVDDALVVCVHQQKGWLVRMEYII